MKTIEVRDQVRLPLRRCFQLCVRGIRYRLFRSGITVVIVSLAVAFLMMMISTSYIDREVETDVRDRTVDRRLLEEWLDRLSMPMTAETLTEELVAVRPGSLAWEEVRQWGGMTDEELAAQKALATEAAKHTRYLAKLEPGERSALVGTRRGESALTFLAEPGRMNEFLEKAKIYAAALPGEREWLEGLVKDMVDSAPRRKTILAGHAAAVASLAKERGARSVLELLGQGGEGIPAMLKRHGFLLRQGDLDRLGAEARGVLDAREVLALLRDEDMRSLVADRAGAEVSDVTPEHLLKIASGRRGARWLKQQVNITRDNSIRKIRNLKDSLDDLIALQKLTPERIAEVSARRHREIQASEGAAPSGAPAEAAQLSGLVHHDVIRRALGARLGVRVSLVKGAHVFEVAATVEGARWLMEQMVVAREKLPAEIRDRQQKLMEPLELSAERIAEVATIQREQARLSEVMAGLAAETEGAWMGFSDRTVWLIIISFLVCVVGVTNAMLMSVTERFREIATMKCLGALDSFIMIIFVLESSLQGLAGGAAGVLVGLALGMTRSLWGFGTLVLGNLPGLTLLTSAGVCVVAGVVLAALAAVYPAWVAARLAPMEAMRIE